MSLHNKQLLDPIGTMCKLISLNFTKINAKLSIQNHILDIHQPNTYQSVVRLYTGDSKENISELYLVIIRIIKWYLITEYSDHSSTVTPLSRSPNTNTCLLKSSIFEKISKDSTDSSNGSFDSNYSSNSNSSNCYDIANCEQFKKMVKYLCSSLNKLQHTYRTGNVVLALQFYINILTDGLRNIDVPPSNLPDCFIEEENLLDYAKIKNLWDVKKITRICELYDCCFKVYNDSDISDEMKTELIKGYLRSVDAILAITDKEFQKLIKLSNAG